MTHTGKWGFKFYETIGAGSTELVQKGLPCTNTVNSVFVSFSIPVVSLVTTILKNCELNLACCSKAWYCVKDPCGPILAIGARLDRFVGLHQGTTVPFTPHDEGQLMSGPWTQDSKATIAKSVTSGLSLPSRYLRFARRAIGPIATDCRPHPVLVAPCQFFRCDVSCWSCCCCWCCFLAVVVVNRQCLVIFVVAVMAKTLKAWFG